MRKINFVLFLFLFFVNCSHNSDGPGLQPNPYNIEFSPNPIKIGEILTITYNMRKNSSNEYLENDLTVDSYGLLKYTGSDSAKIEYIKTFKSMNGLVEFGIKIRDGGLPYYQDGEDKTICYNLDDYESLQIYPEKYFSFKWGEIKCYIPNNAKSSLLKLNFGGVSNSGFSEKRLIIHDESGDEIR